MQSVATAASEEIEIQICDDEIIEFELTAEKSSEAGETKKKDAEQQEDQSLECRPSWRCYQETRLFKSSEIEQPGRLKEYLEEVSSNPFNHYCLNCK